MQQQSALICICQFWEQLLWDECLTLSVRETLLLIPQPENNSPLSKQLWGVKAGTSVLQSIIHEGWASRIVGCVLGRWKPIPEPNPVMANVVNIT